MRLPEWAQRAFFPARYESELIESANHDAYVAANESLMLWVFSMHNHYFQLTESLQLDQAEGQLADAESEQLDVARWYMVEFENLGVFISSFPEGKWVRMRMVEGYLKTRYASLGPASSDTQQVVLERLMHRFDIMMQALPEYAR